MNIAQTNPNVKFTSRLHPIQPSVINTVKGKIRLYEATPKEIKQKGFAEELMSFFCMNEATLSDHPIFELFTNPENVKLSKKVIKVLADRFKHICKYDDGNMTLLLARNTDNKLCGACFSFGYDEIPAGKTVCYIDAIAVSQGYRNLKLGKIMMNETIQSAKNAFSDMFLKAETNALGFYKSLGFTELNENATNQKKIIDYIVDNTLGTGDYPRYIRLCSIPLKNNTPRWYNIAAPEIDNIKKFSGN